MAKHSGKCSVCNKGYIYYDASPGLFCSVYCQLQIDSIDDSYVHKKEGKVRPAITVRSIIADKLRKKDG
tara:strand:- start:14733 stop:14939 length:207 start_codon:yes stop_codon:yes gene_type:complete